MNMDQNKKILKILKKKCGEGNELYQTVLGIYTPWKQRLDDSIAEANFEALCSLKKGEFQEKKSLKAIIWCYTILKQLFGTSFFHEKYQVPSYKNDGFMAILCLS